MPPIRVTYPPPANEQDFEELCLQILRVHYNRPQLELYGHRGESQSGVDIFDPSGIQPMIGAQCKLHRLSKGLRPAEVRAEVHKARSFTPPLSIYFILTTAKRTSAAYQAIAALNEEHIAQGLFQVQLMTWERIDQLLQQYPHVANSFYKTLSSESIRQLEDDLTSLRQSMSALRETLHTALQPPATPSAFVECMHARLVRTPSRIGPIVNVADFEQQTKMLLGKIRGDDRIASILNGVHFPICIPKCEIGDYGLLVDELFLPAVKRAYEATFANRSFQNKIGRKLHGQLAIARECSQERLIEKMATGSVVGILFPVALQGYSVLAAREAMAKLPKGFVLSGVLDICVAMIEYSDVLARDDRVPTVVCAGTTWQGDLSLCFHPNKESLNFCVQDEAFAIGSFSPGLLYIS